MTEPYSPHSQTTTQALRSALKSDDDGSRTPPASGTLKGVCLQDSFHSRLCVHSLPIVLPGRLDILVSHMIARKLSQLYEHGPYQNSS